MGVQEISVTEETGWVPLTNRTWITAHNPSELQSLNTAQLVASREIWRSLQVFHDIAMRCLKRATVNAHRSQQEQIRNKREIDRMAMDRAVHALASSMDTKSESDKRATDHQDPLLAACQLVGREQGIEIANPGPAADVSRGSDPLETIARISRVRIRRVAMRDNWWTKDNGPLLAFLEQESEPVALLPTAGLRYVMVNPGTGTRHPVTSQLAETISSFAFVFYRPFPDRVLTAIELLRFGIQASSKQDVVTMLLMAVAVGLLALVTPIATGIIFDAIIPSAERQQLVQLTAILAVMAIGSALFQMTRGFAVLRLEAKMGASVQAGVWDRLLRLPAPFFRDYLAGDLASWNAHTEAFGTYVENGPVEEGGDEDGVLYGVIFKIMELFE
jgi:ATP-binding cassette subfamily C protein